MKKILTVVVPTYNAEKYLETNLKSFCSPEWMQEIEVLVINDGSNDGSLEIAETYCRMYPQTYRVISKENGGHGSGINYGIRFAEGKYFKVVDADDWVDQKAFANLVSYLKASDSDLVYSGFLWAFDKGEASVENFKKKPEFKEPFSGVKYGQEYAFDDIAADSYIKMHNITIKTEILKNHDISMDENCFYVDSEYISYPIPYVQTVSFLQDFVYMYRIGAAGQSISIEQMIRNEGHYDRVIQSLIKFYKKLGNEIPCSAPKKKYLAEIAARVIAGKYKIMLCAPASREIRTRIRQYDEKIRQEVPDIYDANCNSAVNILRKTRYYTYGLASMLVKRKY